MLSFFEWCESTVIGTVVRESIWAFPIVEAFHLLGLSLLLGAVFLVDLRLLGAGLTRQTVAELAASARRWRNGGLAVMGTTGLVLFLSEAVKCYYSTSFWVKMTTLVVALIFTFTVRDRVARNGGLETSGASLLVGGLSIVLWLTVAAAGRWIGYSS